MLYAPKTHGTATLDAAPQLADGSLPGSYGVVTVNGNQLVLFESSAPLIGAVVNDIRQARARVWIESYIFADDEAGRAVADALIERAQAGLDVRVIYDAIGSLGTPTAFFDRMSEAGVQVSAYLTFREAWRRASWWQLGNVLRLMNRRNHRKLVVIDNRVGYFGGMNIVDQRNLQSVEDVKQHSLPSSAGWRDLHVRADGPIQAEIAGAFDRIWRRTHRTTRTHWPRVNIRPQLESPADSIVCYDLRPSVKDRRAANVFIPLIRHARRQITLSMAYFIPVPSVMRELRRARRRGVIIRVIVPGESDVPAAQYAARYFYSHLIRRGIRIFERKDRMLHSKVMVVDDEWTVVGSCNLDPRSFRLNLEFMGVIRSLDMARATKRIIAVDLRNSRKIQLSDCRRQRWWQRAFDRLCWSFRSLL